MIRTIAALSLLSLSVQDEFTWQTDLDAARAQAEKDGKPLLVVFR